MERDNVSTSQDGVLNTSSAGVGGGEVQRGVGDEDAYRLNPRKSFVSRCSLSFSSFQLIDYFDPFKTSQRFMMHYVTALRIHPTSAQ